MSTNLCSAKYKDCTLEQLIERLVALEGLRSVAGSDSPLPPLTTRTSVLITKEVVAPPPTKSPEEFNFANHPKRKIALKYCYSGWEYGRLACQTGHVNPVTDSGGCIVWDDGQSGLVDPSVGMEGSGWEMCGRTDKGVSAAGHVVSLWVRSVVGGGSIGGEGKRQRR